MPEILNGVRGFIRSRSPLRRTLGVGSALLQLSEIRGLLGPLILHIVLRVRRTRDNPAVYRSALYSTREEQPSNWAMLRLEGLTQALVKDTYSIVH